MSLEGQKTFHYTRVAVGEPQTGLRYKEAPMKTETVMYRDAVVSALQGKVTLHETNAKLLRANKSMRDDMLALLEDTYVQSMKIALTEVNRIYDQG